MAASRATHGWQLELPSPPPLLALSASSLRHSLDLARNLQVDRADMQANVEVSQGLMLAESFSFALAASMGRERAVALMKRGPWRRRAPMSGIYEARCENGAPPNSTGSCNSREAA